MRPITLLAAIVLAAITLGIAPAVFAQNLSLGISAGAGLTGDFPHEFFPGSSVFPGITDYSTPKRYIVGAMLELGLPSHFSVEVDALYRPLGYTFAGVEPNGTLNSVSPATVVTWEFPVLAKYRLSIGGVRPFLEAGPSFRATGNLNSANPSHDGITAGLGVGMRVRGVNIAPVLRYTRWASDYPHSYHSVMDQVELLVGFSPASQSATRPLGRYLSVGVFTGASLTGNSGAVTSMINVIVIVPRPGGGFSYQNQTLTSVSCSGPNAFIVGPMLELELPRHLSVETGALYWPLDYAYQEFFANGKRESGGTDTLPIWQFPVLAKYRFPASLEKPPVRPFLELGPSFRLPQGLTGVSHYGITAGAGVEFTLRRLKIAPAFRYTHGRPTVPWQVMPDSRIRSHS